jgi:hypothetical protein
VFWSQSDVLRKSLCSLNNNTFLEIKVEIGQNEINNDSKAFDLKLKNKWKTSGPPLVNYVNLTNWATTTVFILSVNILQKFILQISFRKLD